MAAKQESMVKIDNDHSTSAASEKDKRIIALEKRIAFLEDELRQKCDKSSVDSTWRKWANVAPEQLGLTEIMLDAIPIPVFYKDAHGRYTGCNKAFAEFIGRPRDQIVGSTVFDVSPTELAEVYSNADEILIRRPGTHRYEGTVVDALGVKHDVIFHKATLLNSDGTVGGLVGSVFDVTQRKLAERALRESEERLKLCIAAARMGTFDWDIVNNRQVWSPETYEIHGLSPDTPLSFDLVKKMVFPEDRRDDIIAAELDPATNHGGCSLECRIVRALDGTVRWINTKTRVIFSGEGAERRAVRVLGVVQDITERRQAEEALLRSRQLLQDVIENFPGVVFWKDRSSVFLGCNKNFSNAAGQENTGSILGKTDRELPWADTEAEAYIADDREVMESGMPKLNIIETQLQAGGRIAWFDTSKVPLFDAGGKITGVLGVSHDITERKQAEQALRESEKRLKQCTAIAHLGIIDWDIVNDRHVWSSETYEIFGVPRETPLTFDLIGNLIHPDDRRDPRRLAEMVSAASHGDNTLEYRIFRLSDGAMRWVEQRASAIFAGTDPERRAVRILGVVRDITERKQAEEALRESEERLRLCTAAARLGTLDWDPVRDRHVWSPEIFEIFGLPPDTVLTLDLITDMVYPGDRLDDAFAAGMSPSGPGEFAMEYRIIRASDRAVRWVLQTMRVIFEGEGAARHPVRALGVVQDITERKQAEMDLRESEEKFRVLAETSPVCIMVSQDQNIVYANNAAVHMSGYTFGEMRQIDIREFFHPDDWEAVKKLWLALLRREIASSQIELRAVSKGGEISWFDVTAGYIYYGGKPALISTAFDITPRKRLMEALEKAKAQSELYLDLMGHDINNMHQIALGYLELAQGVSPGVQQGEMIGKSIEVLERSTKLIQNVRKLQKLDSGALNTSEIDVVGILAEVWREYGSVPSKTVTLNLNGHEKCLVRANELLFDVFANLVNNAIKHTGDGTSITIDLADVPEGGHRYYRISVDDNGPGIPDDSKARIFNRLTRGRSKAKGMGLGLYLVNTLVDSYSGKVWVEDRVPGDYTKGARFVVLLPAVNR